MHKGVWTGLSLTNNLSKVHISWYCSLKMSLFHKSRERMIILHLFCFAQYFLSLVQYPNIKLCVASQFVNYIVKVLCLPNKFSSVYICKININKFKK